MIRGTKPIPTSLKKARGNPGKRPLNRNEPRPIDGPMAMPAVVAACPIASRYFTEILSGAPPNMLAPIDLHLVARLAITLSVGEIAITELRTNGFMTKSGTGTLMQSPWLGALNRSTEIARKLSSELGLPPPSRSRMDAVAPLPDDGTGDFDQFLASNPQRLNS